MSLALVLLVMLVILECLIRALAAVIRDHLATGKSSALSPIFVHCRAVVEFQLP